LIGTWRSNFQTVRPPTREPRSPRATGLATGQATTVGYLELGGWLQRAMRGLTGAAGGFGGEAFGLAPLGFLAGDVGVEAAPQRRTGLQQRMQDRVGLRALSALRALMSGRFCSSRASSTRCSTTPRQLEEIADLAGPRLVVDRLGRALGGFNQLGDARFDAQPAAFGPGSSARSSNSSMTRSSSGGWLW
jgi:hypothetical protein